MSPVQSIVTLDAEFLLDVQVIEGDVIRFVERVGCLGTSGRTVSVVKVVGPLTKNPHRDAFDAPIEALPDSAAGQATVVVEVRGA